MTAEGLWGAVELGGSHVACGVAGADGQWIDREDLSTGTPEATLQAVVAFFARPRPRRLSGVGVAAFGPLDLARGRTLATPKPGWADVPLVETLESRLGVPVALETDVNAAALAEARLGAARGAASVVYVTVGTGVGVGVWLHGRPVHGLLHPELGHLPAPALDDLPGACPFHGRCIEGVASAPALQARLGVAPHEAPDDSPVWEREGAYLAHLVIAAVLCVSPERVVVGGGVARRAAVWPALWRGVADYLGAYVPRVQLSERGVRDYVVPSALDPEAGLRGALLLVAAGGTGDRSAG